MKILHIGKYYPPFHGGIENFMCSLMEQQKLGGHKVSAVVHHHELNKKYKYEIDNGIQLYKVPIIGTLIYAPIAPLFFYYLSKTIKKEKPDIIHIHMPNLSAFFCLLLFRARNTPWVIQWQSDVLGAVPDVKVKFAYPFYRFFEKLLLKKTAKIIVATPPYAKASTPLKGFENKVKIIPLALADQSFPLDRKNNTQKSVLSLLIIGRLTYYKGHALLISALAQLKARGIPLSLKIVGSGELKAELVQLVNTLQLNEEVELLGKLSDDALNAELASTDLLCLPSIEKTEAFGVVLLEAMRASKPCLVSDVQGSGMSWVVQKNKTGFVVKHNCVESLVDELTFIHQNQELLMNYGNAGRKRFEKHFDIKAVSCKVIKLYQSIL